MMIILFSSKFKVSAGLMFSTAVSELFGRNIMSSHSVVRLAEVFCYAPFINNN